MPHHYIVFTFLFSVFVQACSTNELQYLVEFAHLGGDRTVFASPRDGVPPPALPGVTPVDMDGKRAIGC